MKKDFGCLLLEYFLDDKAMKLSQSGKKFGDEV